MICSKRERRKRHLKKYLRIQEQAIFDAVRRKSAIFLMPRFVNSFAVLSVPMHVGFAALGTSIATQARTDSNDTHVFKLPSFLSTLQPHIFWLLVFLMQGLPRIFGAVFGEWGIFAHTTRTREGNASANDHALPLGKWFYLGNAGPEIGVRLHNRPDDAVDFLQSPTIGGILMAGVHSMSQNLWPVYVEFTSSERSTTTDYSYIMPRIRNPAKGWQQDVIMLATNDAKVWHRTFRSSVRRHQQTGSVVYVPYVWMHDTHADLPLDDYMFIHPRQYAAIVIGFAMVLLLLVWSWGLFGLVILTEFILKWSQYHLTILTTPVVRVNKWRPPD